LVGRSVQRRDARPVTDGTSGDDRRAAPGQQKDSDERAKADVSGEVVQRLVQETHVERQSAE
jgi:hypothetical protein